MWAIPCKKRGINGRNKAAPEAFLLIKFIWKNRSIEHYEVQALG